MKNINSGAYPTMITPYNENGTVDYGAVRALTEWYWQAGCDGIFAACQSSEIAFLSLSDRVKLSAAVKETAEALAKSAPNGRTMSVVSSGHIAEDPDEQTRELCEIAATGVDAVVLISNRLDIENTSDERWIADAEKLLATLPDGISTGIYECPRPYKRLLSDGMVDWIAKSGRFAFIKDTCCDADRIFDRLKRLSGSGVRLFNANGQTALPSLRAGAAGYCGIMCNFHPRLYVWLCHNWKRQPQLTERVAAILSMCAFTEGPTYPVTAKYHLSHYENIPMSLYARSARRADFTPYHRAWVDQMHLAASALEQELGLNTPAAESSKAAD